MARLPYVTSATRSSGECSQLLLSPALQPGPGLSYLPILHQLSCYSERSRGLVEAERDLAQILSSLKFLGFYIWVFSLDVYLCTICMLVLTEARKVLDPPGIGWS